MGISVCFVGAMSFPLVREYWPVFVWLLVAHGSNEYFIVPSWSLTNVNVFCRCNRSALGIL